MADVDEAERPVDGRVARRERNFNAVLDVVVDMFTEGELLPTNGQVSKRSGVSVRSIYRRLHRRGTEITPSRDVARAAEDVRKRERRPHGGRE